MARTAIWIISLSVLHIMGVILILVLILLTWRGGKNKQKKRRRRTDIGKSNWEKMCDDGGKFYGW